jgi:hypothetical protein
LQAALLRHPVIRQGHSIIAKLLQTSKDLQAAVGQWYAGQLCIALEPRKLQEVHSFAQWTHKHGSLLRALDLNLTNKHSTPRVDLCTNQKPAPQLFWAEAAASALAVGMQAAAATGVALPMQSFSLAGTTVGPAVLQQLPAGHLTRLQIEVLYSNTASMQAVAALSQLRSLEMTGTDTAAAAAAAGEAYSSALSPLSKLQQVTQLQLCRVSPTQLWALQALLPGLQQLHLVVNLGNHPQPRQLKRLAKWLRLHADVVSNLEIVNEEEEGVPLEGVIRKGIWEFVAALQAASAAPAAAAQITDTMPPQAASSAAAAAAVDDTGTASLRLQSFACRCDLPDMFAHILRTLPAASLTRLHFHSNGLSAGQLAALATLTQLQSCEVVPSLKMDRQYMGNEALQQLAVLQQLTRLQLGDVECAQLQQLLQLRQLQELEVDGLLRYDRRGCWDLSQFTALQKLKVTVGTAPLLPEDRLPPNLRELVWAWSGTISCASGTTFSIQPILALSRLQKLHLWQMCEAKAATATELSQLSSLSSFTDLRLSCIYTSQHVRRAAAVWHCLPLRLLSLAGVELTSAFLQRLTALQGLKSLSLDSSADDDNDEVNNSVTTAQAAAAVQQLTALQHLHLRNTRNWCESNVPILVCGALRRRMSTPAVRGMVGLLQAVGSLQDLSSVHVQWHLRQISAAEAQQVSGVLHQLLPRSLVLCCRVRGGLVTISY